MEQHYDVVVLGAGSAGEVIATTAARAGRSVAVVERRLVGGECPFFACMPSKAMLHSAALRHRLTRVQELGAMGDALHLRMPDKGYAQAVRRRDDVVSGRNDDAHVAELDDAGVDLVRGEGQVTGPGTLTVETDGGASELSWTDLVLSTGARTLFPPVDGLDGVDAWTSDDAWSSAERPASLVIIGGGPIGCEIAQTFRRFGTEVTIVEMSPSVAGAFDDSVSGWLCEYLRGEGITVHLDTQAQEVAAVDGGVRVRLDTGGEVKAERLVVATGVTPQLHGLGLEALGLDPDEGLTLDDRCRVHGADNVWAAGDVTDVAPFTHVANYQARIVSANLTGGDLRADYTALPRAIYTDPTLAGVGMTAQQAEQAGREVATAEMDLAMTALHAADDGPGGRLVVTADARERVLLGATAVGPHAMEWLGEVGVAIRAGLPLDFLADQVHAFPTYSEALGVCYRELAGR